MHYHTIWAFATSRRGPALLKTSVLFGAIVLVTLVSAVSLGLGLRRAPAEPPSLATTRQAIGQLAKMEDDQEFLAKFYGLLAKYHVAPMIRHGNRYSVAADAQLVVHRGGKVALHSAAGPVTELGRQDFFRGVTARGQWINPDDDSIDSLDAIVLRCEQLLILIDLNGSTVGFAKCGVNPNRAGQRAVPAS